MSLLEKMNRDLGMDKQYIKYCAQRNNLYARYFIKKKNGKKREILQPSKELKVLQYWLTKNVFNEFPVSKYCVAYQKGCSIKKNALYHSNSKYILHTDIVHFFESITITSLLSFFEKNKAIVYKLQLTPSDIRLIMDLVLYDSSHLVVGSVASPMISNCFMYEFDIKLGELAKENELKYTRYADDIILSSGNYIDSQILVDIDVLLDEYGFARNKSKTYFMSKRGRREITGVVLDNNNNSLSLGTLKYRELKREIYNLLVKNQGNVECVRGKLAHLKNINNDKYNSLKNTYIKYDKDNSIFK